ncbi:MAG: hypothetical protein ACWGQW_14340 [bacterium]
MKTTSKAIIWIIVVFVMGTLSGSALTFLLFQPDKSHWADHKSRKDRSPDKFIQLISDKLELGDEQREQFRTLMIESRDQFRDAREAIQKDTRRKLETILSPDQLKKVDELLAKTSRHHPLSRVRGPE